MCHCQKVICKDFLYFQFEDLYVGVHVCVCNIICDKFLVNTPWMFENYLFFLHVKVLTYLLKLLNSKSK